MSDIYGVPTNTAGLGSVYGSTRRNPYYNKAAVTAQVAQNAGFAAPLVYAKLGQEMADAEAYDDDLQQQTQVYLNKKIEIEQAKDKRAAIKAQSEALTSALDAAKKIWESMPEGTSDAEKGQAVLEYINPTLSAAGVPPLKAYGQDKHNQRSFEMVIDKDDEGNLHTKQGYISNGQLFIQDGVDDSGKPVFKNAGTNAMTMKAYKDKLDIESAKVPKSRTVQRGDKEITEEFDAKTGQWNVVGEGPKWNPAKETSPGDAAMKTGFTKRFVKYDDQGNAVSEKFVDIRNADIDALNKQGYFNTDPLKPIDKVVNESITKKMKPQGVPNPQQPAVTPSPKKSAQPPVPNAKLAPDGNWYVPDSQRKNGWLRVETR